ncbi:MAG: hypothetical protein ABIQ89_01620 [Candidatus Saccharimonadales bacterium]
MALLTQDEDEEAKTGRPSVTPEELAGLEESFALPDATKPETQEQASLDKKTETVTDDDEDGGWVTNIKGKAKGRGGKSKKKFILAGTGIVGGVSLVLIAIFMVILLIGQLKAVHFATVLRSTGFATSQLVMKKAYSQVAINATATVDSTGSVSPYEKTMLDRLRGINPDKTMKILNKEGAWSVVLEDGKPVGFELNGKRYLQDDFATEAFGEGNRVKFDELSPREKWTVKNNMVDKVSTEFAETLATDSRTFNNSFFKGFRQYFNIKGGKWAYKARELAGKSNKEALDTTREAAVTDITDGDAPGKSILPGVETVSHATQEELIQSVRDGERGRARKYATAAFEKLGGVNYKEIGATTESIGKVSDVVFAVTVYCTAYDIQNSLEEINKNKEGQAQRNAHDIQTTAEQIKSGEVTGPAVTTANTLWDGSKDIPPSEASPLYQEDIGNSLAGTEVDTLLENSPTAKIADTPLKTVLGYIEPFVFPILPPDSEAKTAAISTSCSFLLDPKTQTTIAAAEIGVTVAAAIATDGLAAGVKVALKTAMVTAVGIYGGNYLGEWIQSAIGDFAGTDFSGAETGIDRYNAGRISTDYMNSTVNRGVAYGRPLGKDEAVSIKKLAIEDLKTTESEKSLGHRYFAIDNPYSLVGSFAASAPTSMSSALLKGQASLASLGSKFSSVLSGSWGMNLAMNVSGSQQKVSAIARNDIAAQKDFFGVDQWGWTPQELYKIEKGDDSFDLVSNAVWVGEHNNGGVLDTKYDKCYTPEAQMDVPDEGCDAATLSTIEALHWRLYKLHSSVIDQINDTSVTDDNTGSDGPSNLTGTVDPNLPTGNEDELIQGIKDTGNILGGADLLSNNMKRTTLAVVLKLAQKYKFTINSTIRFGGGPHANGSAIDIGNINSAGVPTGQDYAAYNEEAAQFIVDAATLLPGKSWLGVSNDKFKVLANPIMAPKGGSADLDIPATTGATGAHFHLNVPADAE